jgi:Transglutaminase-like superfamily
VTRARGAVLDGLVRLALLFADLGLRALGLERALRWVGARGSWQHADPVAPESATTLDDIGRTRLTLIGVIMRRRAIWTRTDGPCLRQAVLVSALLRRHHPVVHLGLKGDGAPMAHAWVTVGQVRIDYDPSYSSFVGSVGSAS